MSFIKFNNQHSGYSQFVSKNPERNSFGSSGHVKLPQISHHNTEAFPGSSKLKKTGGVSGQQFNDKKMSQFRRNLHISMS